MTERQRTGRAVQLARKAVGWSQLELAGKAGINKETVVRLEKGENTRYQTVVTVFDLLKTENPTALRDAISEAFPHTSPQVMDRLGVASDIAENPVDTSAQQGVKLSPSNTQRERETEGQFMDDAPDPRRDPDARAILGVYEGFKRQVGGDERLVRELVRAFWSQADRILDEHLKQHEPDAAHDRRKEAGKK